MGNPYGSLIRSLREKRGKEKSLINEMAQAGTFKSTPKSGKITLFVRMRERDIAHFHFYRGKVPDSGKGGGCLMLKDNMYYDHETHTDTLTEKELISLVKFLNSSHKGLGVTMWKYIINLWNDNNPRYKVPGNLNMPNYDWNTIAKYSEKGKP